MTIDAKLYSIFSDVSYKNETTIESYLNSALRANGYNENWEVLTIDGKNVTSYPSGFQGVAYGLDSNNDGVYEQVVIAYRGSDSDLDWGISDLQIALGQIPAQASAADQFYWLVRGLYGMSNGSNISITGHSLGGALAQIVGSEENNYTVTFNAPGMANQAAPYGSTNVLNYVNMNDFIGSYGTHVGTTRYYLPDGITNDGSFLPHSDYVAADFSKYIDLGSEWSYQYAAALWCYDANCTNSTQKTALIYFI